MAEWRPHGRAYFSATDPRPAAICDRCGFLYNHNELDWQIDWDGQRLQNLRILVCKRCKDLPTQQRRPLVPPADPVPVMNPRIEDFAQEMGPEPPVQSVQSILIPDD